jgi:EAL domain-containing protein (putative c-di-GMP-specific phosphodiesterase class I)
VLDHACRQLAAWAKAVPDHRMAMGVNASIQQLDDPGFAARVCEIISSYDLDMDQIVLELTEQSLARDFETAVAVVNELRDAGVSVAVDDFGTGYSSLRYLHRFAADVVKIDRSFVASLVDSDHTQKLVGSVVHMANALDLQTIAEGIETAEQLELVRRLGCELAQGYLFSRPVPPDTIELMLATGGVLQVGIDALPG